MLERDDSQNASGDGPAMYLLKAVEDGVLTRRHKGAVLGGGQASVELIHVAALDFV